MNSTPFEELLHLKNNTDVVCEIDDDKLEALFDDDNPFFGINMDENSTRRSTCETSED